MVKAAWAAIRTRGSYFRDHYLRQKATRGAQKAIVAVAHSMLVVIYHLVTRGTAYVDLGADYQARQNRERPLKRRVKELGRLGYEVTVRDLEAA